MLFHHFLKLCCLALLVSCQEAPSSQPQPNYPTVVDVLCAKLWKMTRYSTPSFLGRDSIYFNIRRDSAAIRFHKDHSFSFYTVPRWNASKNSNIIEGRWEFQDINEEKQVCDGINEQCLSGYYSIILHTDVKKLNEENPAHIFFNSKNIKIEKFSPQGFELSHESKPLCCSSEFIVITFQIIN